MKKVKFNIVILVIICNVFAQEQGINPIEELNIELIRETAKADVKADFKRLKWIRKSFWSGFAGIALAGIGGRLILGTRRPSGIEIPLLLFVVLTPPALIIRSDKTLPKQIE